MVNPDFNLSSAAEEMSLDVHYSATLLTLTRRVLISTEEKIAYAEQGKYQGNLSIQFANELRSELVDEYHNNFFKCIAFHVVNAVANLFCEQYTITQAADCYQRIEDYIDQQGNAVLKLVDTAVKKYNQYPHIDKTNFAIFGVLSRNKIIGKVLLKFQRKLEKIANCHFLTPADLTLLN